MITKAKLIDKAKDLALEKSKDIAIKKLEKLAKDDGWVGVGVGSIWGLSDGKSGVPAHRFHIAAVQHDAAYYMLEFLLGEIEWEDLPTEPLDFREFVKLELDQYKAWKSDPYSYVKQADREFYEMCKKLAGSNLWLRFQAELFYRVIDKWSDMKFERYKQMKGFAKIFNDISQNMHEAELFFS